jgi:NADPH2:quinone reductase
MTTMRAVVLESVPAPPEGLKIKEIPVPKIVEGKVLIKVKAFGLNRSGVWNHIVQTACYSAWLTCYVELHTRIGLAEGVTFPRVLGIEACGIVEECPGGEFEKGQQVSGLNIGSVHMYRLLEIHCLQVCAMMGGMGRGMRIFRTSKISPFYATFSHSL